MIITISDNRVVGIDAGQQYDLSAVQILDAFSGKAIDIDGRSIVATLSDDTRHTRFLSRQLETAVRATTSGDQIEIAPIVRILGNEFHVSSPVDDHLLIETRWFPLEHVSLEKARAFIKKKAPSGTIPLAHYPRMYEDLDSELELIDRVDIDVYRENAASATPPVSLTAELYPYQQTGYTWLAAVLDVSNFGTVLLTEISGGSKLLPECPVVFFSSLQ